MTDWTKTLLFVAAAVASVGLAVAAETLSRPAAPAEFERVGEQFYPEFADPLAAKSLRVVTYDEANSIIKPFEVTFEKGRWRISPYGYPADAEEQLAKTAASVVGIRREGQASRRESDFARLGVVDPLSEDATALAGRGRRVTLTDAKGRTLADYIIGNPVEGAEGSFYVRAPGEKETYRAKVDVDLTTKFADWIKSDLLDVAAADLKRIEIRNYSVDEDARKVVQRDDSVLARDEPFGPWTLAGLIPETEQTNTAEANKVARALDELKIVGVRPKPAGLNPDLTLDPEFITDNLALQQLAVDLRRRGFLLMPAREGDGLDLIAKEGQIAATTKEGVAYDLYFGDVFTGSAFDVEFGDESGKDASRRLKDGSKPQTQQGRYVFVKARFDVAPLGDPPKPPSDAEAKPEDGPDASQAAAAAQAEYARTKREYDSKVDAAKKKVADLNDRFRDWYYVISPETFNDLRVSRAALISPKPPAAATTSPMTVPDHAVEPTQTPAARKDEPVEAPKPAE